MVKIKGKKGITLVTLVVVMVVSLILAGVVIYAGGMSLAKAQNAQKYTALMTLARKIGTYVAKEETDQNTFIIEPADINRLRAYGELTEITGGHIAPTQANLETQLYLVKTYRINSSLINNMGLSKELILQDSDYYLGLVNTLRNEYALYVKQPISVSGLKRGYYNMIMREIKTNGNKVID